MAKDTITDKAALQLAEATDRVQKLRTELAAAEKEETAWQEFIARMNMLQGTPETPSQELNGQTRQAITIQRNTWPGLAYKLIKDKGAVMSVSEIMKALAEHAKEKTPEQFRNVLNSALWRRSDVFVRTKEGYDIKEVDVELID